MKQNKLPYPGNINLFRTQAVMCKPNFVSNLLQQLFGLRG